MRKQLVAIILLSCSALFAQETLSLEAYRTKVQNYSQVLKQTKEQTLASDAGKKIAYKGYLPKLDFTANGTLDLKEPTAWDGAEGEYRNHTYTGQLTLSQPLYAGGVLKAQNRIAQADLELSQLSEELTLDQINYQADAVYWNASANLALYQSAGKFQGIVKEQYNIISDRFEDGLISRTDLLMISTRLKEADLQLLIARKNYTLSMQALHILMGAEPNAPMETLWAIGSDEAKPMPLTLDKVLERRADFVSSKINISRQEAVRKAAISKFNPQLGLALNGSWGSTAPNIGYDPKFAAMAGINLSVPIFYWGERKQTNLQNKALINIRKLEQSLLTDNINQEFSGAWTKITESENQVTIATENMQLAQENLDLATFSYNEGKASMVDVLSAQLSWTQAQSNLINANLSYKMALAEYRKVVSLP